MDLRNALKALRKYWWLTVVTAFIAVAAGALVTIRSTPKYESTVTFFINTPSDQIIGVYQGDQLGQKRAATYVQLLNSDELVNLIAAKVDTGLTPTQINSRISGAEDALTVLFSAVVTDTSPDRAQQIAEAISTEMVAMVKELETPPGSLTPTVELKVVSGPSLETTPISPSPIKNMSLAAIVGVILGAALSVLREVLDTSVRSTEILQQASGGAPVLTVVPYDPTAEDYPLVSGTDRKSIRAEAFRQLRTNLQFVTVDTPVRLVVITSAVTEEGKTSAAANLAIAFAEAGRKVLLIDGDLRRPRVGSYLNLPGSQGLTNVLAGQVSIADAMQTWGAVDMKVLTSGHLPPNPSEILGSQNMRNLLQALTTQFDMVLVDAPPALLVTDAAVLAEQADGVILVVRHGSTSRNQIANATTSLTAVRAAIVGTVLNAVPLKGAEAFGADFGFGYEYTANPTGENHLLDEEASRIATIATIAAQPGKHSL